MRIVTVQKYLDLTVCVYIYTHYIAKSIGSPPFNERFDYFSNFLNVNVNLNV